MWGAKWRSEREAGVLSSETTWVPYFSPLVREISTYLTRHPGSSVVDLSRARSANVDYYGRFGAKVFVEDLSQEISADATASPTEEDDTKLFSSLFDSRGKARFNVLMCWDLFNYVSGTKAVALATALSEKAAPESLLYLHTWSSRTMPAHPMPFDLLPDDQLSYEYQGTDRIPAVGLTKTAVNKLFPDFERVRSFLSRTGIEEHLLRKKK